MNKDTLLGDEPTAEAQVAPYVEAVNEQTETLAGQLARNENKITKINEEISLAIAGMQEQQTKLQARNKEIRDAMKEAMAARFEVSGSKKYADKNIEVTYVAPTTRKGVDVKKLAAENPELYKKYEKVSNVSDSIRIKVL